MSLWQPSNDHPGLRRRGEGEEEGEEEGEGEAEDGEAWKSLLSELVSKPSFSPPLTPSHASLCSQSPQIVTSRRSLKEGVRLPCGLLFLPPSPP